MKVKGLVVSAALLALLGGCATYDDGYAYRGDGRYYSYRNDGYRNDGYRNDGYRNDGYYRYNDGWRRWDGDRYYYRGPDVSWGFSYRDQH